VVNRAGAGNIRATIWAIDLGDQRDPNEPKRGTTMADSTTPADDGVTIADNPGEQRYEIFVDGEHVGQAEYQLDGERIVFTHTEVDAPEGHKGLGGRLVGFALDDVRRRGLTVVPRCPFVRAYLQKHPELLDLVSDDERARLTA
jgi:predicted GNAT family acetyltransferase